MAENLQGDQGAVVQEVEADQIPHELPSIYRWVTRHVLGAPSVLTQEYLDELRLSGVIFGGGELERRYRVEAHRPGDRCPGFVYRTRFSLLKIFPVGDHRPFWLSLEGEGRFPSFWSSEAGLDYVPVMYKGLNTEQKESTDILILLFSERNVKPKSVISRSKNGRERMTLARLRNLLRPPPAGVAPNTS
ncbi:hypothetical protein PIB30_087574 [Stylosanthes scabra]|uniref:Uncharacterized protein n=1 Tax=Stylosanthes scabra TaxID=79078 RepID=A0ABU6YR63_9FABA|nr:hypothetical protein [Stylosanthes scabra]